MPADDDTASFYSSRTVTSDTDLDSCSRVSVDTLTGRDVSDEEEDFSDKETTVMEDNFLPDQESVLAPCSSTRYTRPPHLADTRGASSPGQGHGDSDPDTEAESDSDTQSV